MQPARRRGVPAAPPARGSIRSLAAEDRPDSANQDAQVEPERHPPDVLAVVLHPRVKAHGRATADLPQAGDSWLDAEADHVGRPVKLDFPDHGWPGSNHAHFALENVD